MRNMGSVDCNYLWIFREYINVIASFWDKRIENHYKNFSEIFGYSMKPNEGVINNFGYIFLSEKNIDKALSSLRRMLIPIRNPRMSMTVKQKHCLQKEMKRMP
jgi:hypothetical protein